MKKLIKSILRAFGLELTLIPKDYTAFWPKNGISKFVHYELDREFHDAYDIAQKRTQMTHSDNALRRLRHYTLIKLFKNTFDMEGDMAECGTFHGLSAFQMAALLKKNGIKKDFHIFDSFEGLSEIKEEDKSAHVKITDNELREQFAYGEELVRENLKDFDNLKFYKGWIPERFSEVEERKFSFVHIDVDLYEPIKQSIEFFWPRMVDGGIMVFDDYGHVAQFPGAKKSIDEFLAENEVKHFMPLPGGQAYVIK